MNGFKIILISDRAYRLIDLPINTLIILIASIIIINATEDAFLRQIGSKFR